MAQNNISIPAARGNFLTWCISGYMPTTGLCRPLYIAQKLDTATNAVVGEWYVVYSVTEANNLFGQGSIAANMAIQHFCTCPELPLYIAPLDDPPGGTKAVHTITIQGPATGSGTLTVSILDAVYSVGVVEGSSGETIAAALAGQIEKNRDLPFTVENQLGVIVLTAKNAGPHGDWFEPIWNPQFGNDFPPGIPEPLTATTVNGVGVVEFDPAVPVFMCAWDCIALGTEDETAVNKAIGLIRQNWACNVQGDFKGGHLFHSFTEEAGTIAAYGRDRNNPEETVVPVEPDYKYPGYLLAAAFASRVCCTACIDPSRPVQYDNGILGCLYDSRQCTSIWTSEEKKAFYDAGIANWDVANARGIRTTVLWIEEPLTTYKYDPYTGSPDGAWQRVESRYTTAKFVRDLGFWYRRNYSSVSLVSDGVAIPQGKRAVSPRIMQASILAWLRGSQLGWTIEATSGQLEKMVRVQREITPQSCDPNRLSVMIDLDLVNQLARIATTIDVSPEFACIPPAFAA